MCCKSRGTLSRLAVFWGLVSFATLLVAFVSGSWIYTKEPITLPNSDVTTVISFRIGLWRICPSVKRVNSSIHVPSPACSLIKYSGWQELRPADLGVWTQLDWTPSFLSKMRSCTVLTGSSLILVLSGFFLAMLGHCNTDNKTLVACGLFILGGLSLGTGLMVFASVLSETLIEATEYHKNPRYGTPLYDYRYGWCFFTAGAAFIMTKMTAVFALTGYLNRFPSVDEMVRETVPGADRKMREHKRLSPEYLVRRIGPIHRSQYDPTCTERSKCECECGPLLKKTPPDVCTTNKSLDFPGPDSSSTILVPVAVERNFPRSGSSELAGQTVPIQIKNHNTLSTLPCHKYGTISHGGVNCCANDSIGMQYENRSRTLQPQRPRKKCMQVETFQSNETAPFVDYSCRTHTFGYSGSAV